MKKRCLIFTLIFLNAFIFSSCKLASEDKNTEDTLIGVYITEKDLDLFDIESYLNENVSSLKNSNNVIVDNKFDGKYSKRIYAKVIEKAKFDEDGNIIKFPEFKFESLDGTFFYLKKEKEISSERYQYSIVDDPCINSIYFIMSNKDKVGLNDGFSEEIENADYTENEINAEICLDKNYPFFVNVYALYIDSEGKVFISVRFANVVDTSLVDYYDEDSSRSVSREDMKRFKTENGKEKIEKTKILLSVFQKFEHSKINILELNSDNKILNTKKIDLDNVPNSLSFDKNVDYIIVEFEKNANKKVFKERKIYSKKDRYFEVLRSKNGVFLENQDIDLKWSLEND